MKNLFLNEKMRRQRILFIMEVIVSTLKIIYYSAAIIMVILAAFFICKSCL